jgi:hypothetical protein
MVIRGSESLRVFLPGACTRSLFLLGLWIPYGFVTLWCSWGFQLSCRAFLKLVRVWWPPSSLHSGSSTSLFVGMLNENMVCHCVVWGLLCFHIAPVEISTCKGVNLGIHHLLRFPSVIPIPKIFTGALYFVHFT